jgi:hypothetical protein
MRRGQYHSTMIFREATPAVAHSELSVTIILCWPLFCAAKLFGVAPAAAAVLRIGGRLVPSSRVARTLSVHKCDQHGRPKHRHR